QLIRGITCHYNSIFRQEGIPTKTFYGWRTQAGRVAVITWLKLLAVGQWFYLYLIEDVSSRNIVGYEVHRGACGRTAETHGAE
uniref:hypothetical protein n=1 Tax=unclassified Serratia (in: enterobacteria) TaxID=2647522 RepID=UPI0004A81418